MGSSPDSTIAYGFILDSHCIPELQMRQEDYDEDVDFCEFIDSINTNDITVETVGDVRWDDEMDVIVFIDGSRLWCTGMSLEIPADHTSRSLDVLTNWNDQLKTFCERLKIDLDSVKFSWYLTANYG